MSSFSYTGFLPASKSLMNRALIAQSFFPNMEIIGESSSDDVLFMKQGVTSLLNGQVAECGHAGTVLRFLAVRASREKGKFKLNVSDRLFSRPINELLVALRQLGSQCDYSNNQLVIESQGWCPYGDAIQIQSQKSSQFISALLLNSWGYEKSIAFSAGNKIASPLYLKMTCEFLAKMGMQIEHYNGDYVVLPNQKLKVDSYTAEIDMSCAFSIAAMASVAGSAKLLNWPKKSLQPDFLFTEILEAMGVRLALKKSIFEVNKAKGLRAIKFDLKSRSRLISSFIYSLLLL